MTKHYIPKADIPAAIACLRAAKTILWDGTARDARKEIYVCWAIAIAARRNDIPESVKTRLKRWVMNMLGTHRDGERIYTYETWLTYHHPTLGFSFNNAAHRIKVQQARREWVDWMIQKLEVER